MRVTVWHDLLKISLSSVVNPRIFSSWNLLMSILPILRSAVSCFSLFVSSMAQVLCGVNLNLLPLNKFKGGVNRRYTSSLAGDDLHL